MSEPGSSAGKPAWVFDRNDLALAVEQRQIEVALPRAFDPVLQEVDPFQRMGYR